MIRNANYMTTIQRTHLGASGHPRKQQGVVLLITLIVLVAMMLAGIGMIRSVDTGTLVAGNIAFREVTVQAGEAGMNTAYNRLMQVVNSANQNDKQVLDYSHNDVAVAGFCASVSATLCNGSNINFPGYASLPIDPCEVYPPYSPTNTCVPTSKYQWWKNPSAWNNAQTFTVNDNNGRPFATVSYLIHRMCTLTGPSQNQAAGQRCQTMTVNVTARNSQQIPPPQFTATLVYYRITTRTIGPRNTISYAQQLVVIP